MALAYQNEETPAMDPLPIHYGTVHWYNERKGFGFIMRDSQAQPNVPEQVFVHYSEIRSKRRSLTEGQKVAFNITETANGIQATTVRKIT